MGAFVGAAAAAVFGLKPASHVAARFLHPHWFAVVAAVAIVFGLVYLALRLVGASLARRIHKTDVLGALDRTVGLLFGLVRGLVVLGALFLMFTAATPADLQPRWLTGARTWPLASDMGRLLRALAPKGLNAAGRLKPTLAHVWGAHAVGAHVTGARDRTATEGYDARNRSEVDDLVEKSR